MKPTSARLPSMMPAGRRRRRRRSGTLLRGDGLPQTQLAVAAGDDPPFALLAEDLALEPVDLVLGRGKFRGSDRRPAAAPSSASRGG